MQEVMWDMDNLYPNFMLEVTVITKAMANILPNTSPLPTYEIMI